MSITIEIFAGIGLAIVAVPLLTIISIFLLRANIPTVAPGSILGPFAVGAIGYLLMGLPTAVAGGISFLLLGIILHPIIASILAKFGGRSPYGV